MDRDPPSIIELIRAGVVDAALGALVWVLVEGRIPVVIAAPPDRLEAGADLLRSILASFVPDRLSGAQLRGTLDAAEARALVAGVRPGAVIPAASLEDVRRTMSGPGILLSEDELSFLGCVLVLGAADAGHGDPRPRATGALRVVAAHYVRPVALDMHGHRQLLGPAVIATWDAHVGRYEHFAWGVVPEIASRLGRRAGDLDADLHHRKDDLEGLVTGGVTTLAEVRGLIAGYRVGYGHPHGAAPH